MTAYTLEGFVVCFVCFVGGGLGGGGTGGSGEGGGRYTLSILDRLYSGFRHNIKHSGWIHD